MDKLTAIRTFIDVAKYKSFTLAAEQQDLTRLQASRHVQLLEAWLKQRLLHRTTRQVSLTPAGENALVHFETILAQIAELERQAEEQSKVLSGVIRISTPMGFANTILIDIVQQFGTAHPAVKFDIVAKDALSDLVEEQVDIALRFTYQPDEQLIARRLLELHSLVCVSPAYFATHGPVTHPNDLAQHNCLVHLDMTQWRFREHLDTFNVKVNGNLRANSMETLINAAIAGYGVVYAPSDLASPLIKAGKLLPLLADYTAQPYALWAVYLSRSYQTPRVRQFIDFLAEQLQKQQSSYLAITT